MRKKIFQWFFSKSSFKKEFEEMKEGVEKNSKRTDLLEKGLGTFLDSFCDVKITERSKGFDDSSEEPKISVVKFHTLSKEIRQGLIEKGKVFHGSGSGNGQYWREIKYELFSGK